MTGARRKNPLGLLFLFWVVIILAVSSQSEAAIWNLIRDYFFPPRTCQTTECAETARRIIANRNDSVRPCEDFYEYVCGGWKASNPVPENRTKWNMLDAAQIRTKQRIIGILEKEDEENDTESIKKARRAYRACLTTDEHADENMQLLLSRQSVWGGWPIAMENWDETKFDWKKVMVNLMRKYSLFPLLSIGIQMDRKNRSKSIVMIDQGAISRCYDHAALASEQPMTEWIIAMAKSIAGANNQKVPDTSLDQDAQDIIDTEKFLCTTPKYAILENELKRYNPMTLKMLQNFTDSSPAKTKVNWVELLKDIFVESAVEIDENLWVIVAQPEAILKMLLFIDTTPLRKIANYMLWMENALIHSEVSKTFREMGYKYTKATTGVTGEVPRWQSCVDFVHTHMEHVIGYEYVKLYFSEEEKKKAQELFKLLVDSYIEELKQIDWMAPKTRGLAVEKAENMIIAAAYPDWYNKTNVDKYYEVDVIGTSHLINIENMKLAGKHREGRLLGKPLDPLVVFFIRTAYTDAYYIRGLNMMLIPAGIIQEPFYIKGRPVAMNYGGIGMAVGHEISHAFDVAGRLADKYGNLADWWDAETLKTYQLKKECVQSQYNEYPIPDHERKSSSDVMGLDGNGTVSENIADMGGLKTAFQAYRRYVEQHGAESRLPGLEEYTPEQLFFIGFATAWCESSTAQSIQDDIGRDVHSPKKYRVLIPLGESKEFAEAFQCQESDSKVTKKCNFW